MPFATIDDRVLHWHASGNPDGLALVFANALGTDLRIWDAVVPAFADRYRVIRYDARGHGLSDAPGGPASIDDHVDDLLALLDGAGVGGFALVGLSVGGMVAQRLAAREPARVKALVLCATAARIGTAEAWAGRIATVEAAGLAGLADAVVERWFTPGFRRERPADLRGWRNMLLRTPAAGYASACALMRDTDLAADASRIQAPTLALVGDGDAATPPDLVRATADAIPGARFALVAGAAHIPCIEQPAAVAGLIVGKLEEAGFA